MAKKETLLRKNVLYSIVLTVSLYFLQFVTFPYVTRVMGADSYGIYNFCFSYIQFFTLLSGLGTGTLGLREIAKCPDDREARSRCFSSLWWFNIFCTAVALVIYVSFFLLYGKLSEYRPLMWMGVINIASNAFIVEWLFRGLQQMRYITVLNLSIRLVQVVCIFLFVRSSSDYPEYMLIMVLGMAVNAVVNWNVKGRFVDLRKPDSGLLKSFAPASVLIGIYLVLANFYNHIIPFVSGLCLGKEDVGLFSAATKTVLVVLLVYNAYTLVLLPHISSKVAANESDIKSIISRSYILFLAFSIPAVILLELFAGTVMDILAGKDFVGSVQLLRMSAPLIFLNGFNQINVSQCMIPFGKDRAVSFTYLIAVTLGVILLWLLSASCGIRAAVIAWYFIEAVIFAVSLTSTVRLLKNSPQNADSLLTDSEINHPE